MDTFHNPSDEQQTVSSPLPLSTGGKTPNKELRAIARNALSGKWGIAVLVVFLFFLVQNACAFIPVIGTLVQWIIIGPLMLGFVSFFMSLNRKEPVEVGILFNGFSRFGQGLGIYIITSLLIMITTFVAAIPGGILILIAYLGDSTMPMQTPLFIIGVTLVVILSMAVCFFMYLRYAMAFYIANDDPSTGVFRAIKRSTEMMYGHKQKLLFLFFSFTGWFFLGFLALFVGMLWPAAYLSAAIAAFYDDLAAPTTVQ
jgi:uncharacterized membrane protein